MRENALVRAEGLGRSYGGGRSAVSALADATFVVRPEERIALVGPSGSGKSTLLHLIAGLDRPTTGTIEWPALGARERLRPGPVGVAFQGPSLLPPLTVLENVALPIILSGGSESEGVDAARDLLEAFDASALADRLPEELSGGQSQRAGLARAFAGSPRLVLADEPTGQQDHATADRLLQTVFSIASLESTALVLATHDRAVAELLPVRWSVTDGVLRTEAIPCSA